MNCDENFSGEVNLDVGNNVGNQSLDSCDIDWKIGRNGGREVSGELEWDVTLPETTNSGIGIDRKAVDRKAADSIQRLSDRNVGGISRKSTDRSDIGGIARKDNGSSLNQGNNGGESEDGRCELHGVLRSGVEEVSGRED